MSTRSAIGYKTQQGKIRAVYCHSDGYVKHNGRILQDNYQAAYKIAQLIEMGDLSVLDAEIGVKIDFEDRTTRAANRQCLYYGRDRGEKDAMFNAREFADTAEFVKEMENMDCEYFYLFNVREWTVCTTEFEGDFPVMKSVAEMLQLVA